MNRKDKLYYDLINAYNHHSYNDTLITTYVNKVLKLVKDYLDFDNLKKENQELLVNKNLAQAIALKYKKALDLACEKFDFLYYCLLDSIKDLDYVCPVTLTFIDDLERKNRCWEKYFLNLADVEVLE